jgi:hypothetical protein
MPGHTPRPLSELVREARPYAEIFVERQRGELCPTYFRNNREHLIDVNAQHFAREAHRTSRSVAEIARRHGIENACRAAERDEKRAA